MTKKYVCLKEGCTFVSEDENEAMEHNMTEGHRVVEVLPVNSNVDCSYVSDTGEDLSDEEVPETEEMSDEEEQE